MDFRVSVLLLCAAAVSSLRFASSSPELGVCQPEFVVFRCGLEAKCPRSLYPNPPLEVDGDTLDRIMDAKHGNGYTAVLFYASWCPFSRAIRPKFDALASMFPQIQHMVLEHSLALPSVFSRYGVHSLPSILMVKQTSKVRHRGKKDLASLVQFYKKTTGLHPIQYVAEGEQTSLDSDSGMIAWLSSSGSSRREIVAREPYLVLAMLFLLLKLAIMVTPRVLLRMKALWASHVPRLNLGMMGDNTCQLFGRALHMIDVRRIWMRLRLTKTRNFHERAQVWASSLASVSLGKSSSSQG
ncbi:PREDICTED: 5'-adenylylsulfate reductase-like 7 [Tarenaya hassleriana]|uniref:5'-adenylylsulfate reductase-like 7 n=1 Tax=Tarenaya hassleriana TaxID=28532 RepID=UPI00053C15E7|nr:PREDICTED: 5'-adenylylsulfate reductase-like 7 [Tarenaya hassleriana]XP_010549680.1 PREDICTED: 5'-adenylylsulfate reductase-like 7 [Tarenaya hassleriana]XP_010549681.1 PREDICTED: 5'-adenylylsulfate reductase-like 7 [Tarenaya hassleriana]XP_010549682.1 PREDICTED: 5'-adenylylsulfate reductase-like 7 [Tarenaya hassleriana]